MVKLSWHPGQIFRKEKDSDRVYNDCEETLMEEFGVDSMSFQYLDDDSVGRVVIWMPHETA